MKSAAGATLDRASSQTSKGAAVTAAWQTPSAGKRDNRMSILQMPISPATETRIVAIFNEGVVFEDQGRLDEAADCYEHVLRINPNHCSAHINLGTVCYNRNQFADAITHYRKAVKADPRSQLAHFNLANALEKTQNIASSIKSYETALSLDPRYADAHYNLARILEKKGQPRKAIKHWRIYVKLDPIGPWANAARGQIKKTLARDCLSIVA